MAKNSIRQMDIVAINNADVGGISLAEGVTRPPAMDAVDTHLARLDADLKTKNWDGLDAAQNSDGTAGKGAYAGFLSPVRPYRSRDRRITLKGAVGVTDLQIDSMWMQAKEL